MPWSFSNRGPSQFEYSQSAPGVGATDLIDRVYENLVQREIPFAFSYFMGDALFTDMLIENQRIHFYLPWCNVAIMVAGGYFYDSVASIERVALQVAMLQYAGVKTYVFTEGDIYTKGIGQLLNEIPELGYAHEKGGPIPLDYEPLHYREYWKAPSKPFKLEKKVNYNPRRRHKRAY
jgi:hypothetical protein